MYHGRGTWHVGARVQMWGLDVAVQLNARVRKKGTHGKEGASVMRLLGGEVCEGQGQSWGQAWDHSALS